MLQTKGRQDDSLKKMDHFLRLPKLGNWMGMRDYCMKTGKSNASTANTNFGRTLDHLLYDIAHGKDTALCIHEQRKILRRSTRAQPSECTITGGLKNKIGVGDLTQWGESTSYHYWRAQEEN